MTLQLTCKKKNMGSLLYINSNIRICIICGHDKIESYEFGVSCEECGTSFGRIKC